MLQGAFRIGLDAAERLDQGSRKIDIIGHVHLRRGPSALRADGRRLKQVVLNLLSNATKFTEPGGIVVIRARDDRDAFSLIVEDTGIGMSPSELQEALRPFGQVRNRRARRYSGTGLGLPLAKAMVELRGGTLHIDTRPDYGTRVTIALPPGRIRRAAAQIRA